MSISNLCLVSFIHFCFPARFHHTSKHFFRKSHPRASCFDNLIVSISHFVCIYSMYATSYFLCNFHTRVRRLGLVCSPNKCDMRCQLQITFCRLHAPKTSFSSTRVSFFVISRQVLFWQVVAKNFVDYFGIFALDNCTANVYNTTNI